MTNGAHETISGRVEARNERGIRIGQEWFNRSQFRPIELPDVGTEVRLVADSKGFISQLEVIGGASPAVLSDDHATRLAVLNAAVHFATSRPDMKSADVLVLAERWLEWVQQ